VGSEEADMTEDHDVEVVEVDLRASTFTLDAVIARLAEEGIGVVRSSPAYLNPLTGGMSAQSEHKLVFRAADREAVGEALRDAGII
jgi:DNA-binding transcriptional MocR family regulator